MHTPTLPAPLRKRSLRPNRRSDPLDLVDRLRALDRLRVELLALLLCQVGEPVPGRLLVELEAQLDEKKVTIEVDEEARHWLAVHGHDPKMGARPMGRLIQEKIKKALAEELLFGRLEHGGTVRITVVDDDLSIDFDAVPVEGTV